MERKTLSFGKGMTNVPSDLLSDDSELLESDGFIFRDGEMKPIQNPVKIGEITGQKIMFVHKMADYENIIAYDEDRTIYWYVRGSNGIEMPPNGVSASFEVGKVKDIKSIGNTLVVATEDGLHYLIPLEYLYIEYQQKYYRYYRKPIFFSLQQFLPARME